MIDMYDYKNLKVSPTVNDNNNFLRKMIRIFSNWSKCHQSMNSRRRKTQMCCTQFTI